MRLLVTEVHNFGGFFGGDTVTLSGAEWRAEAAEERTLTIDQAALANVADRHSVAAGMLLDLAFAGERVERATLLGAGTHAELRRALGEPALPAALDAPVALAHRCAGCALWVPTDAAGACPVCGTPVGAE
jgi:rubrerythrin